MNQRILMIEDDHRLATMITTYLGQNGFEVQHCDTAQDGFMHIQKNQTHPFALVLLDLMLPDANGLDVCRQIRALPSPQNTLPIVMLTAKGDPMDRVVGLELGADDYLPKPFEPRELLARLRAVLRRQRPHDHPTSHCRMLRFGRLEIDFDARIVRLDDRACNITSYQFNLLAAMAERAGRVLSRGQLMDMVKGEPLEAFDRSIDVHIGRLRTAIEDNPKHPKRIITVRGAGYVFAKAQDV